MFDSLLLLLNGFVDCLSLMNIFCAIVGSLLGSLIGVLPGLGISGTVAILLPLTYGMSPLSALIMISGIYFGSQYGGAITSILVNIPGEATSIVTCFDGHPMAREGKAGKALCISSITYSARLKSSSDTSFFTAFSISIVQSRKNSTLG